MTLKKLTVFTLFIFSVSTSFGIGMRAPNLNLGGVSDEDCGVRSNTGNANALSEVSCMLDPESCLHQAAWYQDRDNSMSDANDRAGDAMAIFRTQVGATQGIQVCPGVYLATAHGVLGDGNGPSWDAFSYPLSRETRMLLPDRSEMTSPWLTGSADKTDPANDYVFIKMENPVKPQSFVTPVRATREELVEASSDGRIDIHLYRGKTRYATQSDGTPDFTSSMVGGREMTALYQSPQRVDRRCELKIINGSSQIGHDCPVEQSVSGSQLIANIDGAQYIAGMATKGEDAVIDSMNTDPIPNSFLGTEHFCADFENVCGTPCAELSDLTSEGVSL